MTIGKRKEWIDVLRAIAIIFVVFGHNAQWCGDFFCYTTPIKIPLFFSISGYLFNVRDGKTLIFLNNWFKKLVFPFFCLVTIPAFFYSIKNGIDILSNSWYKMISGDSYWFMNCIIIAEVIHFIIRKYCKATLFVIICSLIISALGLVLCNEGFFDFCMFNTALVCQVFFAFGYLIRRYEWLLDKISIVHSVILLVLYVSLCFISKCLFDDYLYFDCHLNHYYNIPYCLLLIVVGVIVCFSVVKKITKFPRWLVFLGQNTLIVYLWAGHTILFFVVLHKLGVVIPDKSLFFSTLHTIWACGVCMGASYIVNRHVPFIVGKL